MGAVNQYYITMLVTNEQEHAIRSKFKEKKWPCHLTVLSSETVHGIIQNGFTDAFPSDNLDNVESALYKEIKSEVVNLETEEIWNGDQSESLKRETPRNYDGHGDSDDEEEDSDDITDDNNDASEQTRNQFENYESEISKKTSKTKRLKVDRTAKVYKNTERRVKCSLCDVELASKSILKRHCQRIHPDDWFEFQCADCPSMFKTQSDRVVAMCKTEEKAEEHYEDDRPFKRFKSSADNSPLVEISEPDVATSEVSMSCVSKPDESKLDVVEPGVSEPGVLKPGVSKPDVSRSESSESENNERNTCKTTDWAVKILKDWITEVGYDGEGWEEWPAERLDSMLEKFYSSLRTQKEQELWKHRDEVKHTPPDKTPKQFDKSNHTPEELREMGHLECKECGKFFHNDRMLRKHLYYAHRDLMPVPTCAVCGKQFKTRQELWKHKKETKHNDCVSLLKHYQCDSCGKVLKGGYYSFVHHKTLACGKEEKELQELKVLPCDICGTTFKTKHQIQCHKKAVHLNAPEVCDVCGNVYKNQMALKAHKKRHDEKNRKYACNDCGRSFFNITLLKQHIRIHTKEKPFKCPMCNYTSACKENIGKHTVSVHKVKAKAIDIRKQILCDPVTPIVSESNGQNDATEVKQDFAFHTSTGEVDNRQFASKPLTSFDVSTGSYVEMMNSDVNPQTFMQATMDAAQCQYSWDNTARR